MEPFSSAQLSQMWLCRSLMLLDLACQIQRSSSTALFLLSVIGLAVSAVRLICRKRFGVGTDESVLLLISFLTAAALFGIGLLYSFSIAWFAEFVWLQNGMQDWMLNFYNVGLIPLLSLFYLTGLSLLARNLFSVLRSARRPGRRSA